MEYSYKRETRTRVEEVSCYVPVSIFLGDAASTSQEESQVSAWLFVS